MSEIKRLKNLLLKEFNLISYVYVQELSDSKHNISSQDCLLQDWFISHYNLKWVQKINCMGFLLAIDIDVLPILKMSGWLERQRYTKD
jgi:hypothetical protein